MNKDLERDIEALFGHNFERCSEAELTEIYNIIRPKMRSFYEKSRATTYKICDKCSWTFPRLTDKCKNCSGELREFEVPFDDKFKQVDFQHSGDVKAR